MNKRIKKKKIKQENKKLINEYPFLMPKNVWTGKPIKNFDYSFTLLDDMPKGWKKAFGKHFCADLKNALIKANFLDKYYVMQVKEKYGTLRWYDNGGSDEVHDINAKYEHISAFTCIECGKINVPIIDEGWIQPMCECCYNRHSQRKISYGMKPNYKKAIINEAKLTPTFKVTHYSKEGEKVLVYDCLDILKRLNVNINNLSVEE